MAARVEAAASGRRVESSAAVPVGSESVKPMPATDEPVAGGLPGAGVGRVFGERCEHVGELGDAVERSDRRPVAVGARHAAECMTDVNRQVSARSQWEVKEQTLRCRHL